MTAAYMRDSYLINGKRRAVELGNRGPLELDAQGRLARHINDAYWHSGFYIRFLGRS